MTIHMTPVSSCDFSDSAKTLASNLPSYMMLIGCPPSFSPAPNYTAIDDRGSKKIGWIATNKTGQRVANGA